ncbi:serine/threonine protein kinase [Bernardetia litoralis DSM 6794]|uniref:Serine/threonine protein kinase n=1 Tax=Bernardetia litoralis (strain ATCC 23117 / DSM 6794 / NBRC 15988 / NCIMB 1366 / Fx l1 / Sio-4) TaxID=880071 RepID=I4ANI9_BERLS|nr:serine/threonine-protein kinase [Bernardetia litoralis]AFM05524.1 serine/threonine protein kinase [Bernardetia litoralis DSM 6794]
MNANRWQLIQDIFSEALELEGQERENYILSKTKEDTELKQEVENLLQSSEKANSFFGNLEGKVSTAWQKATETTLLSEGEKVGIYQIEKEIGRGGMAVVYLAKRIDGEFEQKVAIKVIKRGMDSDEVLRRFMAEKQILASLNHPNISKILNSGLAPNGLPYFVMEYVEGMDLIEYCDKNNLSIKERLEIFIQICRTLQYAHRNLVIHRDLKPSNILIENNQKDTTKNTHNSLKLLDFGIAKVLDEDNDLRTKTAMRLLTPEYASPEQIQGKIISTSSDIYQLGILLFELLSGRRPFVFDKNESVLEWEKKLTTSQTPTPSKIYEEFSENQAQKVAKERKTDKKGLKKTLKSELQSIVLMALRTEPERRYQSAEQLAEDIERYLQKRPIIAKPNSWSYKTRKAFERNKSAWIGFTLLFIALIGGIFGTTYQAYKTKQEKQRAEQTLAFITDLFKSPDPRLQDSEGKDIKVSEFLKASEKKVFRNLEDQQELQTELLTILSNLYDNMNLAKEGTELEEKLLPKFIKQYGRNSPRVAESIRKIAAWSFETNKDVEKTDSIFQEAFDIFEKTYTKEHNKYAVLLNEYGLFLQISRADLEKAESILQQAGEIFVKNDTITANYGNNLSFRGLVANQMGRLDEALSLYERELFIKQKVNQDSVGLALVKINMASVYFKQQNLIRAETINKEALKIMEAELGMQHKHTLTALNNLAAVYAAQDRHDLGKPIALRAYNGFVNKYGEKNDRTAASALNVGFYYTKLKEFDSALVYINQANETYKQLFGETHYVTGVPLLARAEIWLGKNEPQKAFQDAQKADELLATPPIPTIHYYRGMVNFRLGSCYIALNDKEKGKKYLQKSVDILMQTNGKTHYATKAAMKQLAVISNQ